MLTAGLVMIVAIAAAIFAATTRNIVHAIFALAISLGAIALAFLILKSPFVAAMEVLIYIGGISVAMVFAVMLSSVGKSAPSEGMTRRLGAGFAAIAFFAGVAAVLIGADLDGLPVPETSAEAWSVQQIGRDLLDRFNVVFELLSVVLLLAILGAVTIASRNDGHDEASSGNAGAGLGARMPDEMRPGDSAASVNPASPASAAPSASDASRSEEARA